MNQVDSFLILGDVALWSRVSEPHGKVITDGEKEHWEALEQL